MEYCVNLSELDAYSPEGHKATINKILIDQQMGIHTLLLIHGEVHPGGLAEMHSHPFEQAFYVLAGRGRLKIGGKEYDLKTGSAYCAPAGIEHQVEALGPTPLKVIRVDSKTKGK